MSESLAHAVRMHIFTQAAETGRVPQLPAIAEALGRQHGEIREALLALAEGRVLILAPNGTTIWAANPFCAVPSPFQVEAAGRRYWGICIWDALGIAAALDRDASIRASCGDCGTALGLEIRAGALVRSEGVIHFGVPARRWWDNIGFT